MNILMISFWDFQEHGMQVTLRTPLFFAEHGHKVTFLVHSETTQYPAPLQAIHPNIEVIRYNLPLKWLGRIHKVDRLRQLLLFCAFSLSDVLGRYRHGTRPDVIYAAECDAILVGLLLRYLIRAPLITRYYGISTELLSRPWSHWAYALSVRCPADMAIVTDDGTNGAAIMKRINPWARDVVFLRNGVDSPVVDPGEVTRLRRKCGISDGDLVLLTVSRLYGWKRVDRAVRAVAQVKRNRAMRVKLLVVGHGPEEPRLKELAKECGVCEDIVFVGAVAHADIYNVYAASDILLSLYDMSNVGNPLWEAMNAGKCIITLDAGNTRDVIEDGVNGRMLPLGSDDDSLVGAIAGAITELRDKPCLRRQLAEGAKAYAAKHVMTWEQRLKAELDSIVRLASKRHVVAPVVGLGS